MKKILLSVVVIVMVLSISLCFLVGCNGKGTGDNKAKKYYNNETDPLVFSIQEVDGVFNPFFSSSGTDSQVVGMTQLGMLGNDSKGNPVCGEDEACIVLDYDTVYDEELDVTTYYFVLKNNVKFSNGSPLTIKDVLFNLYVYLDPVYSGSSTIYSTEIVGLQEYRTQKSSKEEQDNFRKQFETEARKRIDAVISVFETFTELYSEQFQDVNFDDQELRKLFDDYQKTHDNELYSHLLEDYDKTCKLFKEELQSDYNSSKDSYQDFSKKDDKGTLHKEIFTTDVEMFLYNEGYYTWNGKDGEMSCSLVSDRNKIKNWTEEYALETVYADNIPNKLNDVLRYWATGTQIFNDITNQSMEKYFADLGDNGYQSISGIKFANYSETVAVKGVDYQAPTYADGDHKGAVVSGNEVLSITIRKIDPKAIWNFAFGVAPMYYYSSPVQIELFDYQSHFGVVRGSQTFMNEYVKNPRKIGVPVGAGPYVASKASGGIAGEGDSGEFKNGNVIYYTANPYYLMGEPLVKNVRYQVISSTQLMNALQNNEIDFIEPSAKPDVLRDLNALRKDGYESKSIQTSGYGYIGINAGKVPSIYVRQAIMHSIDTSLIVSYYKTTAEAIYRSMSKASWAYPKECTSYYPYIGGVIPENLDIVNPLYKQFVESLGKGSGDKLTKEEQKAFIRFLVGDCAEYNGGTDGEIYYRGNNKCKYTFTVAGDDPDHPAFNALYQAGQFLNEVGFDITVTTDSNALKKLSSDKLKDKMDVWAAAWGSTIDPDMYQVYHKDSLATSTTNWGYKQIKDNIGGAYDYELALLEQLSDLIDQGRQTDIQEQRAKIYSDALDILMQLAVELPTYQRDDLFAYNANKIDVSTFNKDVSPYKGLTTDMHLLSLVVER